MDRLEAEFAGRLRVIRVDVQSATGRSLGEIYGFQFTPAFIFFDAEGGEAWRSIGSLPAERVREALQP